MTRVHVERRGGLAGFGLGGSRVRSVGEIDLEALGAAERKAVDAIFTRSSKAKPRPDEFVYRVTRTTNGREQVVEVPESVVPSVVRDCVRDELV